MEKKETPQDRYRKKMIKRVAFDLNINTDADILLKLESVINKNGYIKQLIREDMKREENNEK